MGIMNRRHGMRNASALGMHTIITGLLQVPDNLPHISYCKYFKHTTPLVLTGAIPPRIQPD